jgi:hypothetical protein
MIIKTPIYYHKMICLLDLPNDIINDIYHYSGIYHDLFNTCVKQLDNLFTFTKLTYITDLNKHSCLYIQKYCNRNPHRIVYGYMREMQINRYISIFTSEDMNNMFNIIKDCKCCSTHQSNCPKHITDKWDPYPKQREYSYVSDKICSCPCRAFKRNLVKSFISL